MSAAPLRALVVDDEPAARAAMCALLAADADITVEGECADGRTALAAIRGRTPDILFLDVQMPEMDGFALLRALALAPAELPVVVFVTAFDHYALKAFEARALDYVLKPFDDERFREAVARAKAQARQKRVGALSADLLAELEASGAAPGAARSPWLERLVIKSDGRAVVVPVADVDWLDADGDHVVVHAGRERHLLRETMKVLEGRLDPAKFVRIHRSTIVNVARIRELQPFFRGDYVVLLEGGTRLKLARGSKARLEAALGRGF